MTPEEAQLAEEGQMPADGVVHAPLSAFFIRHRSSKHPGSKKSYQHRPRGRGNAWRVVSRPVRSLPGWKKRVASGRSPWSM